MMRTAILSLTLVFICVPAFAQTPPPKVDAEKLPPMLQAGQKAADEAQAKADADAQAKKGEDKPLTEADEAAMLCQAKRIMGSTESADYKPGVDAYGRPVAPADASSESTFSVPDRVDIPLNITVLQQTGIITSPTPDLATNVGTISVLKGGKVLYNDKDMTNTVDAYCASHSGAK